MEGVLLADHSEKPKSWGPKILTYLRGEAERLVEHLELTTLSADKGHEKIFEVLDKTYPKKAARDLQAEALTAMFGLKYSRDDGEMRVHTGRARVIWDKGKQRQVDMPEEDMGFLLLRGCCLTVEQRAVILAIAGNSYKFDSVAEALNL